MVPDISRAHEVHGRIIANANVAGEALVAVARDLRTMRDEKLYISLGHETFEEYAEMSVGIKRSQAYKFISALSVLESNPQIQATGQWGVEKLAAIASLPEPERENFVSNPQPIPSTGETKTVAEMTTRELAEAVRARKEAEKRAEELAKQNEQLEQRLKEATLREPEVVEVYKVPEEVQQALNEAQSELKELRERKNLTTNYQKEIRNLEERIADLMEAQRKLQNAHDEEARRQASSSEFVAVFRRAAKPLKEAKGDLERLAHSGYVHWSSVREIESDLRVLYSVLDMVDDMLKTVDVSEITEGVVVP